MPFAPDADPEMRALLDFAAEPAPDGCDAIFSNLNRWDVLADWLDERGDPRGALLRGPYSEDAYATWIKTYGRDWLGELPAGATLREHRLIRTFRLILAEVPRDPDPRLVEAIASGWLALSITGGDPADWRRAFPHVYELSAKDEWNADFAELARFGGLRDLSASVVGRGPIAPLGDVPRLRTLDLTDLTGLVRIDAPALGRLPELRWLRLADALDLPDAALDGLRASASLRWFNAPEAEELTDLSPLGAIVGIRHVEVRGARDLTDAGVAGLAGAAGLWTAGLWESADLTDAAAVALARHHPELREIDFDGCTRLTDAALAALGTLPHLERLYLDDCRKLTDAGLASLAGLSNLQRLSLRDCPRLTDAGVARLADLPRLDDLALWGCRRVTPAAVAALREAGIGVSADD